VTFERESEVSSHCISQVERKQQLDLPAVELRHGHPVAALRKPQAVLDCAIE
jgi:hypothetical protein